MICCFGVLCLLVWSCVCAWVCDLLTLCYLVVVLTASYFGCLCFVFYWWWFGCFCGGLWICVCFVCGLCFAGVFVGILVWGWIFGIGTFNVCWLRVFFDDCVCLFCGICVVLLGCLGFVGWLCVGFCFDYLIVFVWLWVGCWFCFVLFYWCLTLISDWCYWLCLITCCVKNVALF